MRGVRRGAAGTSQRRRVRPRGGGYVFSAAARHNGAVQVRRVESCEHCDATDAGQSEDAEDDEDGEHGEGGREEDQEMHRLGQPHLPVLAVRTDRGRLYSTYSGPRPLPARRRLRVAAGVRLVCRRAGGVRWRAK